MNPRYNILVTVCFMILFSIGTDKSIAQIPNAGFENWSGGEPVNWTTSNSPPTFVNVLQVSPGHSGSSAAEGRIISLGGFSIPVVLISGPDGQGYPSTSRPAALRGWYKFSPVGGDIFYIIIAFQKNGQPMGGGAFTASATQTAYTEFVANIGYTTGENPDTAIISAQISNGTGQLHEGSAFIIDDLAYGAASLDVRVDGSNLPQKFLLSQNYPNPFNPATTIRYELPKATSVRLEVFNLLGQRVATLVDGWRDAGIYSAVFNAEILPSGAYLYKMQTEEFTDVKRFMLLK